MAGFNDTPRSFMHIAWQSFTPWASLFGGLLIGAAVAVFLLGSGRVAGISGLVGGPLQAMVRGRLQAPVRGLPLARSSPRLWFVGGLLLAPWLWRLFAPLPAVTGVAGPALLVLAGLLVGVGTRMGNGCTSGHGVCGLSRFSGRSLVNVLTFMATGMATVALLQLR
jgi:uncharacterized protein